MESTTSLVLSGCTLRRNERVVETVGRDGVVDGVERKDGESCDMKKWSVACVDVETDVVSCQ